MKTLIVLLYFSIATNGLEFASFDKPLNGFSNGSDQINWPHITPRHYLKNLKNDVSIAITIENESGFDLMEPIDDNYRNCLRPFYGRNISTGSKAMIAFKKGQKSGFVKWPLAEKEERNGFFFQVSFDISKKHQWKTGVCVGNQNCGRILNLRKEKAFDNDTNTVVLLQMENENDSVPILRIQLWRRIVGPLDFQTQKSHPWLWIVIGSVIGFVIMIFIVKIAVMKCSK